MKSTTNPKGMNEWHTLWSTTKMHPFAHAIYSDEWVIVTGVGGHIPWTDDISPDTAEQTRQAIKNATELLEMAGSSFDEVVQVRPYITDRSYAKAFDQALSDLIGEPRPASGALVICQLIDERMHMELEVLAHRGCRRRDGSTSP